MGVLPIATYLVALSGDGVDAAVHAIWETQYAQRNSPLPFGAIILTQEIQLLKILDGELENDRDRTPRQK